MGAASAYREVMAPGPLTAHRSTGQWEGNPRRKVESPGLGAGTIYSEAETWPVTPLLLTRRDCGVTTIFIQVQEGTSVL